VAILSGCLCIERCKPAVRYMLFVSIGAAWSQAVLRG